MQPHTNHKASCAKSGVWLQARHGNVKVFLAEFPGTILKYQPSWQGKFLRPRGGRANYPYTDLICMIDVARAQSGRRRRRMHARPLPLCRSGRVKIFKYGQKTAANCPAAAHKGIKLYSQLAVRLPAT